jgi:hypothetical protein
MDLVFDVVKIIASYDEDEWYKMTIANEEFNQHACSDVGIQEFISLFWRYEIEELVFGTTRRVWKILGIIHSFNDLPAIINPSGSQYWYNNNKIHRDNDKPAITYTYGESRWYQNGLLHRDDNKPAIITSYCLQYFKNGIKYTL